MNRVVDIIQSGGVLVASTYDGFAETVAGLVDSLIANGQLDPAMRDEAIDAVLARESLSSTVMVEIGISIPHARLDGVKGVVGALAASRTGVYEAMAGVPISIVVLVLSSPELAGDHLNVLGGLSMLFQSAALRDHVARAPGSEVVIDLWREQSRRRRT